MGGAMLRRMLAAGIVQPSDVLVSDLSDVVRHRLALELGVAVTDDNSEAAQADVIFLAVKPQFLRDVAARIAPVINRAALVISIVMSYDLQLLAEILENPQAHIVRVMPNTPALVGEGVLAACRNAYVTDGEWDTAINMLSSMGLVEEIGENLMEAVTGVSGCGPAFVFQFIEAMADAGVRAGLQRKTAMDLAAQTLLGSAKMYLETGKHPGELKDMVTSPAGATIEGVAALEKNGFRNAVIEAVHASVQRAKEFETK